MCRYLELFDQGLTKCLTMHCVALGWVRALLACTGSTSLNQRLQYDWAVQQYGRAVQQLCVWAVRQSGGSWGGGYLIEQQDYHCAIMI